MFKKILVPLDGSKEAEKALDSLHQVASKPDSSICLLRVVEIPILVEGNMVSQQILDSEMELSEEYLDRIVDGLKSDGYSAHHVITRLADAAGAILAESQREPYDLILMTSHGRTGVGRFLIGSVAEKVCRHAGCPVLIVGRQCMLAQSENHDETALQSEVPASGMPVPA